MKSRPFLSPCFPFFLFSFSLIPPKRPLSVTHQSCLSLFPISPQRRGTRLRSCLMLAFQLPYECWLSAHSVLVLKEACQTAFSTDKSVSFWFISLTPQQVRNADTLTYSWHSCHMLWGKLVYAMNVWLGCAVLESTLLTSFFYEEFDKLLSLLIITGANSLTMNHLSHPVWDKPPPWRILRLFYFSD